MLALFSLRFLSRTKEDFWFASNVKGVGAFDDVVLRLGNQTFMLQQKHKENPDSIKLNHFLKKQTKNEFYLQKYITDMCKINKGNFPQLGSFSNINFLLYTNRTVNPCSFLVEHNASYYLSDLNSKSGLIYKIDVPQVSASFSPRDVQDVNNFYLFCNQINAKDSRNEIEEEIRKLTGNKHFKEICKDYIDFIIEWSKGNSGRQYWLTRHDVVSKLTELAFNEYEVKLLQEPYSFYENEPELIWNRIIEDKKITIINTNHHDKSILDFLLKYIGSEVRQHCNAKGNRIWSDSLSKVERQIFYGKIDSFESQMLKLSGSRAKPVLHDVYKCLWNLSKLPLLLEINKAKQYDQLLNILQLSNYYFKIIILNKSGRNLTLYGKVNRFENLQHLNREHIEEILEQQIRFQGRQEAKLEDLLDKTMIKEITTTDIINILLNNFNIGKELNSVPKYYIYRSLRNQDKTVDELNLPCCWTTVISAGPGMDNELEKKIFNRLLENKQIVILMDGFDEISISYKTEVTDIAKTFYQDNLSLYLTTRPIEKSYLEKLFNLIAWELLPFNLNHQRRFLKECLSEDEEFFANINEEPEKIVENLLTTFKENVSSYAFPPDKDDFTATPLHIKLLSEVFSEGIKINKGKFNHQFDLVDLYSMFIDMKHKILCDKFESTDSFDLHKGYQGLVALRLLYPYWEPNINEYMREQYGKTEMIQVRLLEKGGILTLSGLSENVDSEDETVKSIVGHIHQACISTRERFFIDECPFLLNVFDRLLIERGFHGDASYKNLHLYVINGQIDLIKETINVIPTILEGRDIARRSILHLIIIYMKQYPSLADISKTIIEKTSKMDLDIFGYTPIDYAFNNHFFDLAGLMIKKWPLSKINIYTPHTKALSISVTLPVVYERLKINIYNQFTSSNLLNLWEVLLAYFAYRDIMLNKVKENESINSYLRDIYPSISTNFTNLFELPQLELYKKSNLCYEVVFGRESEVKMLLKTHDKVNAKDANGLTPLHYAAFYGKTNMIKLLLSKTANPNLIDENYYIPLHYLVINDKLKPFHLLLNKSNVNADCQYYNTPLHYAVLFKRLTMIKLLLSKGAHVNLENFIELTPLHLLAQGSHMQIPPFLFNFFPMNVLAVKATEEECCDMIDLFVANGADINEHNSSGDTPLHYSAKHGNSKILSKLISDVSDVNIILNSIGNTPLHCALKVYNYRKEGYFETVNLLLLKGANVNIANAKGRTPLYYGVKYGDCRVIEKLLLRDADVNAQNETRNTLLHYAISKRRKFDITNLLLSNGANVNIKNIEGKTSLHYGVTYDDCKVVEGLMLAGADANVQDNKGNTPLHEALYIEKQTSSDVDVISNDSEMIRDHTTFPTRPRKKNLGIAKHQDLDTIQSILSQGVNVNRKDLVKSVLAGEIYTEIKPLSSFSIINDDSQMIQDRAVFPTSIKEEWNHVSSQYGIGKRQNLDTIKLLLSQGANANIKNLVGKTPVHYSIMYGDFALIEELMLYEVDVNVQDEAGNTPLHVTVFKRNDLDITRLLLSSGADVNIKNAEGATSLHYAATRCKYQIVEELISSNADINMQDNAGNTPLHYAISKECNFSDLIFSWGANPYYTIKNLDGKSPFYNCIRGICEKGFEGITVISSAAAEETTKDTSKDFLAPIQEQFDDSISLLLSNGADPNIGNFNQETPLHISVRHRDCAAAERLIRKNANVNAQDIEGNTPLDYLFGFPLHKPNIDGPIQELLESHGARRRSSL
ncbi:hypothetical protein ILUMI_02975, partial [Ignelater luminosus]